MTKKAITLIVLCLPVFLWSNSSFSFYGYPYQSPLVDVYGQGMGNTGISDVFRNNSSFSNPSLAVTNTKVSFSSSITFGNTYFHDTTGSKFRDDFQYFPYFNLVIPVRRHRFGFNYQFVMAGEYESIITDLWNDNEYHETNRISSNIYKTDFIYANDNNFLNFGFSVSYFFGNRVRYWRQEYGQTGFMDPRYERRNYFKGPSFSAGINRKLDNISFGLVYSHGTTLDGDSELGSIHSNYEKSDYTFEIPFTIRGGATYMFTEKLKVSFDAGFENWTSTNSDYENTYSLGFGTAYEPGLEGETFLRRIPVRCGVGYRSLPFRVNDSKIGEFFLTGGFSIPFTESGSYLDFSLNYTTRGDKSSHGTEDSSLLFSLSYSGFDIFRRRLRRIEHRDIPEAEFETFR